MFHQYTSYLKKTPKNRNNIVSTLHFDKILIQQFDFFGTHKRIPKNRENVVGNNFLTDSNFDLLKNQKRSFIYLAISPTTTTQFSVTTILKNGGHKIDTMFSTH